MNKVSFKTFLSNIQNISSLILSLTPMETQVILNAKQFDLTLQRLCRQLIENHNDFSNTVLIGLQPRGLSVLNRLKVLIEDILDKEIQCGSQIGRASCREGV